MQKSLSPIINVKELLEIHSQSDVVIIDARGGANAKENYIQRHLNGALYVDLDTQLADIKTDVSKGGRHPLPSVKKFCEVLSSLGISPSSHVVVYDDKNGAIAAARFWWMMKALGHEKVQVLNGGIQQAEKFNFPMNSGDETIEISANYTAKIWQLPIIDIDQAEIFANDEEHILVDVRETQRYNGTIEPIDPIAGHIPGAINIPFSENLNAEGLYRSPEELNQKYTESFKNIPSENIGFHCGSGVTACHSLLAIAYAGLEIPALYVGSWSEWCRNNKAIATNS